ncbi:MAG TPA: hypothetical protein VE645_19875 [Pseudonocardiaceae bacterium]|nr:hypothetical protein [Pseudonocardiaceae bacterium]
MDVFQGVPIGKTQRGQVIYGQFFERNWIVGGRPGQGKTTLVRILPLDPTAELWVFVIAQNTDFKPFALRLTRYQVGMGPDVAAAAVQALAICSRRWNGGASCWRPCRVVLRRLPAPGRQTRSGIAPADLCDK